VTLKFGTDGVRGVANTELTAQLALELGRAAARVLGGREAVVGGDTRVSTRMLEAAFVAGVASEGLDVHRLGEVPTPAVAHDAARRGVLGAMISASHNVYSDNGIKLFAPGGLKLSDDVEARIEHELRQLPPASGDPGRVGDANEVGDYVAARVATLAGRSLGGLRVVVDLANGACSGVGASMLRAAGADVVAIHDAPDGFNINAECGATHPEAVAAAVVDHGADVGLALDGDGDRLIAVDHEGRVVDGDHIIAICARDLHERGELRHDTVVVTVMTNLGFRLAMSEVGIAVVETAVGDRYVLEALDAGGFALGGEQSGHVIFRDVATTGDGLLTGLHLLDAVVRTGSSLAELAAASMTRLPQVLLNVRVAERVVDPTSALAAEIAAVEAELGERGRVLVRSSGTEPLVRVMVEAPTDADARRHAENLAAASHARFG
jgi:phosphoglucosamine mutase